MLSLLLLLASPKLLPLSTAAITAVDDVTVAYHACFSGLGKRQTVCRGWSDGLVSRKTYNSTAGAGRIESDLLLDIRFYCTIRLEMFKSLPVNYLQKQNGYFQVEMSFLKFGFQIRSRINESAK